MKRTLRTVLCLVAAAAVVVPMTASQAQAAQPAAARCRVVAAKPFLTPNGLIRSAATRIGCGKPARLRIQLKKVRFGPDKSIKSGSRRVFNARLVMNTTCRPGTFYTVATDSRGRLAVSRKVRITCAPKPSPSPSPSASPSGSPTATPTATPTTSAPAGSTVGTAIENEVVRLTNAERAKAGCGALIHDAKLRAAAFKHSADMSAKNYFSHTSQNGTTFAQRITNEGFRWTAAAENIAKGQQNAQTVVTAWMNSAGHKANIVNCTYTRIGVGHVAAGGPYWTQDFAKS